MVIDLVNGHVPAVDSGGFSLDTTARLDAAAKRSGFEMELFNPCDICGLKDFCDPDDCGAHLYPLDVAKEPKGNFYDFLGLVDWI